VLEEYRKSRLAGTEAKGIPAQAFKLHENSRWCELLKHRPAAEEGFFT